MHHLPVLLGRLFYLFEPQFSHSLCKMTTVKNLPRRFVVRTKLGKPGKTLITARNICQAVYEYLIASMVYLSLLNLIFTFSLKSFNKTLTPEGGLQNLVPTGHQWAIYPCSLPVHHRVDDNQGGKSRLQDKVHIP